MTVRVPRGVRLIVEYEEEPKRAALADDLVTLDQLPVSPKVARAMIKRGDLPATKPQHGRAYLVRRSDVERVFAPTVRRAEVANDSDEAIVERFRAKGIRVGGAR